MGKVRGLRARVHQAAVRPKGEAAPGPAPPAPEAAPPPASAAGKDWAFINTNIFARTKIDPSALVQKLELDVRSVTSVRRGVARLPTADTAGSRTQVGLHLQPVPVEDTDEVSATRTQPAVPASWNVRLFVRKAAFSLHCCELPVGSVAAASWAPEDSGEGMASHPPRLHLHHPSALQSSSGAEAKTVLPKKEKMKLRREQWLQKIEAIKLAEQKHREERRRRATVVVGDLHPLRDALPELLGLKASSRRQAHSRESNKPRPSELSRMSTAQRQQLLEEERTRFRELLASPAYRARPLVAIGQTLARQMQLEGGGQL
nr:ribosome biogenesis protein SLX9 homolog isoform X1 [Macaca fascicularis]